MFFHSVEPAAFIPKDVATMGRQFSAKSRLASSVFPASLGGRTGAPSPPLSDLAAQTNSTSFGYIRKKTESGELVYAPAL